MKKKIFTSLLLIVICVPSLWAQTTETFESVTTGKPLTLISNGQSFTFSQNDCANGGTFGIFIPSQSWTKCSGGTVSNGSGSYGVGASCTAGNCTGTSSNFLDNGTSSGTNQIYYISTTNSALFTVKALHAYVSLDNGSNPTANGIIFRGKRGGNLIFTITKTSGMNTSFSTNNGFTYFDFSTEGGVDNSNYNIDQLEIQGNGGVNYVAIDNFKWNSQYGPLPTTVAASSITGNTATLNGTVNDNAYSTTVSFDYGTSPTLAGATNTGATTGGTVSANAGNTANSLNISGLSPSTTYYFRVKAVNSVSTNTGSILNFTTTAAPPTITTSGTLSAFTSCNGFASAASSFTVGGTNLTANLVVTPPAGYEVSLSSGSGYASSLSLTPSSGTVSSTTIYVRLASTASGSPSGNVACTSTGATTQNVAVTGSVKTVSISALSQTNISCNGGSNGAASVNSAAGGTASYTYNWTPGNPTGDGTTSVTGLTVGTWTCTVTDANACKATQSFNITEPTFALGSNISNQNNVNCTGSATGSATVTGTGGTPSYTYSWSPGGQTTASVNSLTAGTYNVTVKDLNGCTKQQTVSITEPVSALGSSISNQNNVGCMGSATGSATVTGTGGTPSYTYSWSPGGQTTASVNSLTAGTYNITVKDANGCTKQQTVSITEPLSALGSSISNQNNVGCMGSATGSATVTGTGGTPSYTYSWSPGGQTTASVNGLTAGTYNVTVKDANGCSKLQAVSITEPVSALGSNINNQNNVSCAGSATGSATVTGTGGTPSYTYSWSPGGQTTTSVNGLTAGTYNVTVKDANGCSKLQVVSITEPVSALGSNISNQNNVGCMGSATGSATVTGTGGTPSYTYSWSPGGQTTASVNGLTAGTYNVTVKDANGCSKLQAVSITEPVSALGSNINNQNNVSCAGSATGSATVTGTGGTPSYTYSWSPGGQTTASVNGLTAGTYNVTVKDANGCSKLQVVSITEPLAITGSQNITLCAGQSITVGSNTHSTTGTFNDKLTAANGCDSTVTTHLTVNAAIDVTTSINGVVITANQVGASYSWINCNNNNLPIAGETNQTYTATANGSYAVIVTVGTCFDTSSCVNITTTGIKKNTIVNNMNIYPNPNTGVFAIELYSNSQIIITDVIGRIVLNEKMNAGKQIFNIENETNGIYFMKIISSDKQQLLKLIKE